MPIQEKKWPKKGTFIYTAGGGKSGSEDAGPISRSGAAIEEAMIHSSVNYIYVKNERWR